MAKRLESLYVVTAYVSRTLDEPQMAPSAKTAAKRTRERLKRQGWKVDGLEVSQVNRAGNSCSTGHELEVVYAE